MGFGDIRSSGKWKGINSLNMLDKGEHSEMLNFSFNNPWDLLAVPFYQEMLKDCVLFGNRKNSHK